MTKKLETSAIQTEVMSKINSGSLQMKPRLYFTVLWLLGIIASIAASLTFAYLISIIMYIVRIQTASTPAFGARHNLSDAIASFPWWAVILSVALSAIAIWLMRKYSRIYRYKISSVIILFIVSSLLLGIILSSANVGHQGNQNMNSNPNGTHLQDGNGRGNHLQN